MERVRELKRRQAEAEFLTTTREGVAMSRLKF